MRCNLTTSGNSDSWGTAGSNTLIRYRNWHPGLYYQEGNLNYICEQGSTCGRLSARLPDPNEVLPRQLPDGAGHLQFEQRSYDFARRIGLQSLDEIVEAGRGIHLEGGEHGSASLAHGTV